MPRKQLSEEDKLARKSARKLASKAARKMAARKVTADHKKALQKLDEQRANPNRKHNWQAIREFYIGSRETLTYANIAKEFDVSVQMVRQRASRERWTHLRAVEQARQFKQIREDRYKKNYEEGVAFDDASGKVAKLGMGIVAGRLSQMMRFFTASDPLQVELLERMQRGEPVTQKEIRECGVDTYELLRLAQAASMFQDVGRKAFGTDIEQLDINVGGQVEVEHVVNVGAELAKGDSDRLAGVISVMERLGLVNAGDEDDDIIEAEVVHALTDGSDDEEDEYEDDEEDE